VILDAGSRHALIDSTDTPAISHPSFVPTGDDSRAANSRASLRLAQLRGQGPALLTIAGMVAGVVVSRSSGGA
jgi:hypothetical protein